MLLSWEREIVPVGNLYWLLLIRCRKSLRKLLPRDLDPTDAPVGVANGVHRFRRLLYPAAGQRPDIHRKDTATVARQDLGQSIRGLSTRSLVSRCFSLSMVPLAISLNDFYVHLDGSPLKAFHAHGLDVPRIL